MLTGDNRRTAEAVAKKLGIDEIDVLPDQKIERVPPSRVNEMIPSSSAPKFFASMEAVGAAHGMMISRHPDSLNLKTSAGDWLQYMIKQDRIDIVVIANTDGLTEAQIEARKTELFGLSDKLVAEARSNAAQSKVFE
jgi:magnesium-transporting ATPase (P-type)